MQDGTEYLFVSERVTWDEARLICEGTREGSLAFVKSSALAQFLAEALSETALILEDLWVGAYRTFEGGRERYYWLDGAEYVPGKWFVHRGPENVDVSRWRNCLGFARQYHDQAHFINLECHLKRPFVCQKREVLWFVGLLMVIGRLQPTSSTKLRSRPADGLRWTGSVMLFFMHRFVLCNKGLVIVNFSLDSS